MIKLLHGLVVAGSVAICGAVAAWLLMAVDIYIDRRRDGQSFTDSLRQALGPEQR